jgi:hypothetical protein
MKENLQCPYLYNTLMLQPDGIRGIVFGIEYEQIVLNRPRGFCRLALQTGASLGPCYVFGANQLYHRTWVAQIVVYFIDDEETIVPPPILQVARWTHSCSGRRTVVAAQQEKTIYDAVLL